MDDTENISSGHLNRGWVYHDLIRPDAAGERVLDFYARRYPHSSRETWAERIAAGLIRLDGRAVGPDTALEAGQFLAYHRPPWREPDVPREVKVLHEDPDLIAVAKPAGLPVLPGGGFLENTLLFILRQRYPESPPPAPIHRLGRGTSGLLLLARSPTAGRRLSEDLREGRLRKTYRALVAGTAMPDAFKVEQPIGQVPYPGLGYIYAVTPGGKTARTNFRTLRRDPDRGQTLLEVDIPTGRPHQIRIHAAAAGYPLVGDPLYREGGKPALPVNPDNIPLPGDCGYHLHALRASFLHPVTRKPMRLVCPPPDLLRLPEE
ncbi:MAG: RluA family pseudouridine synthase [Candidatus Latescibacteria bacterium]|nr:RluA family pseudouridine synthase [Candidatus Latescibacterota bacterium]